MSVPPPAASRLRSVIGNTGTLTGGRLMLAVLRFGATLLLLQRAGLDRFGEFALILSVVAIAEWLSDFGLSDMAVRQISMHPNRRRDILGAFAVSKAVQGLFAAAVLGSGLWLAGYAPQTVRAGWIAGLAVVFHSGVQIYRVEFRARQQMGREVGAEFLSAVFFVLAIWLATSTDASLELLTLCYAASRAVNLVAAAGMARAWPALGFGASFRAELSVLTRACLPLGLTGLMVSTYDAMEQIALSQWSTAAEAGRYSFAMRIMMLALVVEQALATAVFPVLAAQWSKDRAAFVRTIQTVLNWGLLIGGALFCAIFAGAQGMVALIKHDPQGLGQVLQCLAWAIPARAAVSLVGPLLLISGQLSRAVWIPAVVVVTKWLALVWLAPEGALGAAKAYLIAEVGVGLVLNLLFCQYASGIWLRWWVPLKIVLAALAVAGAATALGGSGSLLQGVLATAAFLVLSALLGVIQLQQIKALALAVLGGRHGRV